MLDSSPRSSLCSRYSRNSLNYGEADRPIELLHQKLGTGISWDRAVIKGDGEGVDLDLQAVVVDKRGLIVDVVYHNNLFALDGAIGHSGDALNGDKNGLDEAIWVRTERLHEDVCMIIFVVAAHNYGGLKNIKNGKVVVLDGDVQAKVMPIEKTLADFDIVSMFKRSTIDGKTVWELFPIDEPADSGSHFLDILEPGIGGLIRTHIPWAPKQQTFISNMDKGKHKATIHALRRLVVGVGGVLVPDPTHSNGTPLSSVQKKSDTHKRNTEVDIDLSAHCYNKAGREVGVIDGESDHTSFGIAHSGDNSVDEMGDTEFLTIDFSGVPDKIDQIFFVLTVRKDGYGFDALQGAYTRVTDQRLHCLSKFDIQGRTEQSFIFGRAVQQVPQRWRFQEIGIYVDMEDKVPALLKRIYGMKCVAALKNYTGAPPPKQVLTPPPPPKEEKPVEKVEDVVTHRQSSVDIAPQMPMSVRKYSLTRGADMKMPHLFCDDAQLLNKVFPETVEPPFKQTCQPMWLACGVI